MRSCEASSDVDNMNIVFSVYQCTPKRRLADGIAHIYESIFLSYSKHNNQNWITFFIYE